MTRSGRNSGGARWWRPLADDRIECALCPRQCRLRPGQRAACFVRANCDGAMTLTSHGLTSGLQLDPVEKKPLNHFYPGAAILSFGGVGCNLECKFCQNLDISKSRDMERAMHPAPAAAIARSALDSGAIGVAFTYNDPVIFAEYAMECADACHEIGLQTAAITAGYMNLAPAREFFAKMDAANIDLKSFSDDFYFRLCAGRLQPVLDVIAMVRHESNCWLEITNLIIPGQNDADAQISQLARWCRDELGPETPLHFTAYHPAGRLKAAPTPAATLLRARRIALDLGLLHVYTGNIHDAEGDATRCPGCGAVLIRRDWHRVLCCDLDRQGRCAHCQRPLAGRFGPRGFSRRPRDAMKHPPGRPQE